MTLFSLIAWPADWACKRLAVQLVTAAANGFALQIQQSVHRNIDKFVMNFKFKMLVREILVMSALSPDWLQSLAGECFHWCPRDQSSVGSNDRLKCSCRRWAKLL